MGLTITQLRLICCSPTTVHFRNARSAYSLVFKGLATVEDPPMELRGGGAVWARWVKLTNPGLRLQRDLRALIGLIALRRILSQNRFS